MLEFKEILQIIEIGNRDDKIRLVKILECLKSSEISELDLWRNDHEIIFEAVKMGEDGIVRSAQMEKF